LEACKIWRRRYPVITPDYFADTEHVNTYAFMDALSAAAAPDDLVTTGNGTEVASFYQAFQVQEGQRAFNIGWGAMGWDLPVAIGACVAGGRRRTICATGDGSIQWNIQELLTIAHYRLPIKIFVMNNGGYTCIRSTQDNFFEGRFVGADPASGVATANFEKLAAAYGLAYSRIANNAGLAAGIRDVLSTEGPALCELNVAVTQGISPRVSSFRRADGSFESRPIEDMAPFLPREEVWENMHLFDEANQDATLEPAGSMA
jgi:acetolactate synthase-1/2/3 large subunit